MSAYPSFVGRGQTVFRLKKKRGGAPPWGGGPWLLGRVFPGGARIEMRDEKRGSGSAGAVRNLSQFRRERGPENSPDYKGVFFGGGRKKGEDSTPLGSFFTCRGREEGRKDFRPTC